MKTIEEFAALLNGRNYRKEITKAEEKEAKDLGYVVMFGASDDLIELRGAIYDELNAYNGTTIKFYKGNLLEKFANDVDLEDIERVFDSLTEVLIDVIEVNAYWCPKELNCSWLIKPTVPFAPFDIFDDGELYCRGAVVEQRHLK